MPIKFRSRICGTEMSPLGSSRIPPLDVSASTSRMDTASNSRGDGACASKDTAAIAASVAASSTGWRRVMISILGGVFNVIDDKHLHRRAGRLQPEIELLFDRLRQRWPAIGIVGATAPVQLIGKVAVEMGCIDNDAT